MKEGRWGGFEKCRASWPNAALWFCFCPHPTIAMMWWLWREDNDVFNDTLLWDFFSPPHFLVLIWYHHDGVMHSLSRAKFFIVAYQGMRRNMFRVFNYSMCLHFHKDKWGLIIILFYGKPWGKMLWVHEWEEGASVKFIPILWYHASETTILTFSFFLLSNGV